MYVTLIEPERKNMVLPGLLYTSFVCLLHRFIVATKYSLLPKSTVHAILHAPLSTTDRNNWQKSSEFEDSLLNSWVNPSSQSLHRQFKQSSMRLGLLDFSSFRFKFPNHESLTFFMNHILADGIYDCGACESNGYKVTDTSISVGMVAAGIFAKFQTERSLASTVLRQLFPGLGALVLAVLPFLLCTFQPLNSLLDTPTHTNTSTVLSNSTDSTGNSSGMAVPPLSACLQFQRGANHTDRWITGSPLYLPCSSAEWVFQILLMLHSLVYSHTMLAFVMTGIHDMQRRYTLLASCTDIIRPTKKYFVEGACENAPPGTRCRVSASRPTSPLRRFSDTNGDMGGFRRRHAPALEITDEHNLYNWLALRRIVQESGQSYLLRVQVLISVVAVIGLAALTVCLVILFSGFEAESSFFQGKMLPNLMLCTATCISFLFMSMIFILLWGDFANEEVLHAVAELTAIQLDMHAAMYANKDKLQDLQGISESKRSQVTNPLYANNAEAKQPGGGGPDEAAILLSEIIAYASLQRVVCVVCNRVCVVCCM